MGQLNFLGCLFLCFFLCFFGGYFGGYFGLNQTGRAIECLSIVIAVYLLLSLAAAALSHRLEARSLRGTPR